MPIEIIDTPQPVQRFLPRLGSVHTIIRYITSVSPNSAKHIKLAEVRAIAAAGKQLAIVHEAWGDLQHAGHGGISIVDGSRDGQYARAIMPRLGAPAGAAVYFAVDTDCTPAQIKNFVLPYFNNIAAMFYDGAYRVGVYGPGAVCQAVLAAGHAELGWLSNAKGWKGYAAYKPSAALVQLLPTHIAGGLDVDPNLAQVEDWGQFTPVQHVVSVDTVAVTDGSGSETPARLGQGDGPLTIASAFGADPDLNTENTGAPPPTAAIAAAGVAVGSAAAAGATPAAAAVAATTAAESAGAGSGSSAIAATAVASATQMGWFNPSAIKSMFKSKIAWLTGGAGATGATTAVTSDPDTQSLFMALLHRPSFWLTIACILLAGMALYYRWRDHGRGGA